MNLERIKEIQVETAYPESRSVNQALLKVWNECEQKQDRRFSEEDMVRFANLYSNLDIDELHLKYFNNLPRFKNK